MAGLAALLSLAPIHEQRVDAWAGGPPDLLSPGVARVDERPDLGDADQIVVLPVRPFPPLDDGEIRYVPGKPRW
jgi:hypothetical protein